MRWLVVATVVAVGYALVVAGLWLIFELSKPPPTEPANETWRPGWERIPEHCVCEVGGKLYAINCARCGECECDPGYL